MSQHAIDGRPSSFTETWLLVINNWLLFPSLFPFPYPILLPCSLHFVSIPNSPSMSIALCFLHHYPCSNDCFTAGWKLFSLSLFSRCFTDFCLQWERPCNDQEEDMEDGNGRLEQLMVIFESMSSLSHQKKMLSLGTVNWGMYSLTFVGKSLLDSAVV